MKGVAPGTQRSRTMRLAVTFQLGSQFTKAFVIPNPAGSPGSRQIRD